MTGKLLHSFSVFYRSHLSTLFLPISPSDSPRLQCSWKKPLWRAKKHYTPRTFSVTSSSLIFLFLPLRLINNTPLSTSVRISCSFSIPALFFSLSERENLPSVLLDHAFASAVPPPTILPISACILTWFAQPIRSFVLHFSHHFKNRQNPYKPCYTPLATFCCFSPTKN